MNIFAANKDTVFWGQKSWWKNSRTTWYMEHLIFVLGFHVSLVQANTLKMLQSAGGEITAHFLGPLDVDSSLFETNMAPEKMPSWKWSNLPTFNVSCVFGVSFRECNEGCSSSCHWYLSSKVRNRQESKTLAFVLNFLSSQDCDEIYDLTVFFFFTLSSYLAIKWRS